MLRDCYIPVSRCDQLKSGDRRFMQQSVGSSPPQQSPQPQSLLSVPPKKYLLPTTDGNRMFRIVTNDGKVASPDLVQQVLPDIRNKVMQFPPGKMITVTVGVPAEAIIPETLNIQENLLYYLGGSSYLMLIDGQHYLFKKDLQAGTYQRVKPIEKEGLMEKLRFFEQRVKNNRAYASHPLIQMMGKDGKPTTSRPVCQSAAQSYSKQMPSHVGKWVTELQEELGNKIEPLRRSKAPVSLYLKCPYPSDTGRKRRSDIIENDLVDLNPYAANKGSQGMWYHIWYGYHIWYQPLPKYINSYNISEVVPYTGPVPKTKKVPSRGLNCIGCEACTSIFLAHVSTNGKPFNCFVRSAERNPWQKMMKRQERARTQMSLDELLKKLNKPPIKLLHFDSDDD